MVPGTVIGSGSSAMWNDCVSDFRQVLKLFSPYNLPNPIDTFYDEKDKVFLHYGQAKPRNQCKYKTVRCTGQPHLLIHYVI